MLDCVNYANSIILANPMAKRSEWKMSSYANPSTDELVYHMPHSLVNDSTSFYCEKENDKVLLNAFEFK